MPRLSRMTLSRRDSRAEFVLTYEGPALESHRMAVADLAPSLLALGEMFHEANAVLNPGGPRVGLEVKAFGSGSFEITLSLGELATLGGDLIGLLTNRGTDAVLALIGLVGGAKGVMGVLKWLGHHVLVDRQEVSPSTTRFIGDDGSTLDVPSAVVDLLQRAGLRRNARKVVAPLSRDGVDRLRLEGVGDEPVVVLKSERAAFDVPSPLEAPLTDEESEMALAVTVLPFSGRSKWRLSDGRATFLAEMQDEEFLQRIEADQERFARNDILRCRVRMRQWQTDTGAGLRSDYSIVRVLAHIPATSGQFPIQTRITDQPSSPTISDTDQT